MLLCYVVCFSFSGSPISFGLKISCYCKWDLAWKVLYMLCFSRLDDIMLA